MFRFLCGVVLLAAVAVAGGTAWWLQHPLPLSSERVEVSIEPGMTPRDAAQAWVDAGVQAHPRLLYEWFRWSGDARRIRAGSYEVERGATPHPPTPRSLLQTMVQGAQSMQTVRVIEGWTFAQLRAELAQAQGLRPTTAQMSDAQLMAAIGAPGVPPEGRFFPDTYAYGKGVSDVTVLRRAYEQMQRRLTAAWQQRAPDTPLKSADEALILASIVEKETGVESDRGRIAGVFVNRLRLRMPLQTDPSVIYGLGARFDGNLRRADLLADGPFNTYTRSGLPPTPIALPGNAALVAAVRPAPTKALYFVSRGDGSSEFSDNLEAHNRAVNKYQRGR